MPCVRCTNIYLYPPIKTKQIQKTFRQTKQILTVNKQKTTAYRNIIFTTHNENMSTKTFRDVDLASFVYQQPKRNANGGMNLYIDESKDSKASPVFQLDPCVAKFGTSAPQEGSSSTRRNMEISVTSDEMIEFIKRFDEQNIHEVAKNSETFFKKQLSEDVLAQTLYRWSAAPHEKYDPLLRIKVATQGRSATKVYKVIGEKEGGEINTDEGTWEDIEPWSKVVVICQCGGLWFVSKQFGMTLIAKAVLVWPSEKRNQNKFVGYNIIQSNDVPRQPTLTVESASNEMDTDEIM